MGTSSRRCSQATYTASAHADASFYATARDTLYLSSGTREVDIYTPMPAGMAGKAVPASELLVWSKVSIPGTPTLTLRRHANPAPATYSRMTWNNKPGDLAGSTAIVGTRDPVIATLWHFNTTSEVQAIASGGAFYGWRLTSNDATLRSLYGFQNADFAPLLTVTFTDTPPAPTNVSPHDTIGIAAPVVTFTPCDDLTAVRVQVDVVGGPFTSPVWDSGDKTSALAQLDTAAAGWAGLANNASVDLRVQQINTAGRSGWSTPVTITRVNKGTPALNSPGSTYGDPSPTWAWSFTGATQKQFRVGATHSDGRVAFDSGWQAGSDTAFAAPQSILDDLDSGIWRATLDTMTFWVRILDDKQRVGSYGDKPYAEATVASKFVAGTAGAAVTSISATQQGTSPRVQVAWARGSVADEWILTRDSGDGQGEIVVQRSPGVVDGTAVWSLVDWTCPPNRPVTYRIRPVDAGVVHWAGTDPTGVVRTKVEGAWVMDPSTGWEFMFTGYTTDAVHGELSSLYLPLGATAPVKRTFALRGLEGTVSGNLKPYDGRSRTDQLPDVYNVKSRPSRKYRYVRGDVNIPVVISNLTTGVDPDATTTANLVPTVSLTLTQKGELPFTAQW